jgi:hypothetical protein
MQQCYVSIERINKIIEMKDEASLDDLAYIFSNNIKDIKITRAIYYQEK